MKNRSQIISDLLKVAAIVTLLAIVITLHSISNAADKLGNAAEKLDTLSSQSAILIHNLDSHLNGERGILPELKETVKHTAATVKILGQTSLGERANLQKQSEQVSRILDHVDSVVVSAGEGLGKNSEDLHRVAEDLRPALRQLPPLLESTRKTLDSANTLVSDPSIPQSLSSLNGAALNVERITASSALIMQDVQGKVHEATHPGKVKRTFGGLVEVLKIIYYLKGAI